MYCGIPSLFLHDTGLENFAGFRGDSYPFIG